MFAYKKNGLNKEDLGYNRGNPFTNTHRPFKKPHALHLKCKYCSFVGHSIRQRPIMNSKPFKNKKVQVPKEDVEG